MNVHQSSSPNPLLLWFACAILGMAGALLTGSLGLTAGLVLLILATPLILRGDRLAALSGLLIGFGGLWSLLLVSQIRSGGLLSDAGRWIVVGAAPLAIGFVVLVVRLARTHGSSRDIPER